MKKTRMSFGLGLVICLTVSLMISHVWGFGGAPDRWGVDPTAGGTKYSGPLTIYLNWLDVNEDYADMYFFVRLSQGNNTFTYSYLAQNVEFERNPLVAAFQEFIESTLIKDICKGLYCPTFKDGSVALKSIANETPDTAASGDISFKMMDIVIAVKD
jgi:hypothetical protein